MALLFAVLAVIVWEFFIFIHYPPFYFFKAIAFFCLVIKKEKSAAAAITGAAIKYITCTCPMLITHPFIRVPAAPPTNI